MYSSGRGLNLHTRRVAFPVADNILQVDEAENVYTASDETPLVTIELHDEMAYLPYWPKLVCSSKD